MGCSALQLAWRDYVKALKKVAHEIGVSVEGVSQALTVANALSLIHI